MKYRLTPGRMAELKGAHMAPMLRLLNFLSEQERHNRYETYQPLTDQLPFHQSRAQVRGLIGGNRSGKTTAGQMEVQWYARGRHPYRNVLAPNHGWIVALDNEVLEDVILPQLFTYLPEEMIKRYNRVMKVLELTNGSIIKFKSCESGAKKFQSAECRWIWFDEEPPKEIWDECLIRVGAGEPLDVWLTMTPLDGMDWTWEELVNAQSPGEIECFSASLLKNKYLLESEKKRLLMKYAGTEEEKARIYGQYFHRSGLVYKGWNPQLHLCDPFPIPSDWPCIRVIDPHARKPSAVVWGAVSPKNILYIVDELQDDKEYLFSELAEKIKEKDTNLRIVRSLIDPSSHQKNMITGSDIQTELRDNGIYTDDAHNDLKAGWNSVREKIMGPSGPTIKVFRNCVGTWKSLTNLTYEDWRFRGGGRDVKEAQRQKDSDLADCVRYMCMEGLEYEPPEPEWDAGQLANMRPMSHSGYR